MSVYFKCLVLIVILLLTQTSNYVYAEYNLSYKYDIYYLVVGSGHYSKGENMDRPEAINSANQMALNIQKIGGHGKKLLSGENKPVTKNDILNLIYDLKQTIRLDKAKNPLIIFYFMGHGLGSSELDQFIMFGTYDFKNPITRVDIDNNGMFLKDVMSADELAENFYLFSNDDNDRFLDNVFTVDNINNIKKEIKHIHEKFHEENHTMMEDTYNNIKLMIKESNESAVIDAQKNTQFTQKELNEFIQENEEIKKVIEMYEKMFTGYDEKMRKDIINRVISEYKSMDDIRKKYDLQTQRNREESKEIFKLLTEKTGMSGDFYEDEDKISKDYLDYASNKKDIEPLVKESKKLKNHVPYILIIDSCLNGVEGMNEYMYKIINEAPGTSFHQKKVYKDIDYFLVNLLRGDTFKKYGALFFAANPGDNTASVDSVDNGKFETQTIPPINELKTGGIYFKFQGKAKLKPSRSALFGQSNPPATAA